MIDTLLNCAVFWVPVLIAGAGAGFWAGHAIGRRRSVRRASWREVVRQSRENAEQISASVNTYLGR